jgi:hypothetical protein
MFLNINHIRPVNSRKSLWTRVLNHEWLAMAALLLLAGPSCRTTPTDPLPDLHSSLAPIMEVLHTSTREFKRALLLEQSDQYPPLAAKISRAGQELPNLDAPRDFQDLARAFTDHAQNLAQAPADSAQARYESLFSDLMGGCMACHRKYRSP